MAEVVLNDGYEAESKNVFFFKTTILKNNQLLLKKKSYFNQQVLIFNLLKIPEKHNSE